MKQTKRQPSIRSNLTLFLLVGMGVCSGLIALLLNGMISAFLWDRFDAELLNRAQALISLTDEDEEGIDLDFESRLMPQFQREEGPEFFEMRKVTGDLIRRSDSLSDRELSFPSGIIPEPEFSDITLDKAGKCRVLTLSFVPVLDLEPGDEGGLVQANGGQETGKAPVPEDAQVGPSGQTNAGLEDQDEGDEEGEDEDDEGEIKIFSGLEAQPERAVTLVLIRTTEDFDDLLGLVQLVILGSLGLLLFLTLVLVRQALRGGLRPLDEIGAQVMKINPKKLDTRISLAKPVRELVPVVDQLNGLLKRLEDAVKRERRFTGDVAHELRTPLAELRGMSEVGLKDPEDKEMVISFFQDIREVTLEMQQLVSNLLDLSRCDSGSQSPKMVRLRVSDLVGKTCKRSLDEALSRSITLQQKLAPSWIVHTDPCMLEQMIQNLVNNAVTYSPKSSSVIIEDGEVTGRKSLNITNPAPDLKQQDLDLLFDRFWQKDSARTGGTNAGLGLSLVQSYADLLGIGIDTRLEGGRFTITLRFPSV